MKLLIINPNTSDSVTAKIADVARTIAAKDTEIVCVTAPYGVP